ncbi:MAG: hypothetical protein DRP93_09035 [Candidatus Neomarinimicrobiota bacterium]|nr:MAG: hypothetical protein DRP93_09035 [Candidatus Neomarinimicrobiota bacterium]
MKIKKYIQDKIDNQSETQHYHVGMELNISSSMLSNYKTGKTRQPSLELARRVWKLDQITLWPYSERAVKGDE